MTKPKILLLLIVGISVTFSSCKKEEPNFVSGEILFSLIENSSFYDTSELINSLDLQIKYAGRFNYIIKTTTDSVDSIIQILESKQYLTDGGRTFSISYLNDTLHVAINVFDLDSVETSNWLNTVFQLDLKEHLSRNVNIWGAISVPHGKEQYWVDEIKKHGLIKDASLNHIGTI
jgi:hypothetical protein